MPFSDDQIQKFGKKRRLVWLISDSWSWRQVLEMVLFFWKNFSIRFQTGHFCLPTLPKEPQQFPICTPVAQRDGAATLMDTFKKKSIQLQNISSSVRNTCLSSRQLKNSSRRWILYVASRMWFIRLLTSRQCSCPVLSCVQCFLDWETGVEWELEPQRDLKQPPSPGHCIPACRRLPHSPPQTT